MSRTRQTPRCTHHLLVILSVLLVQPCLAQQAPPLGRLDPLVVTATRTETPLSHVGSAVTVITAEELEQQQIRIVSDVLREVPGLAVNRGGSVGQLTQLRIRGAEGNHTLVLIDGMEVNDPSAGSEFDLAHLLATEIERIEILRGPQSVLYGSDAIGGVVNIITKRGRGRPTLTGQPGGRLVWHGPGAGERERWERAVPLLRQWHRLPYRRHLDGQRAAWEQ